MEYGVLGPVELRAAGRPVRVGRGRQQRLLAVLLANAGHVVSADDLVDAVFAGAPPEAAHTTLRSYVARLRRALAQGAGADAAEALATRAPGYVLAVPPGSLDADRFTDGVERARGALRRGRPQTALQELDDALALWRGPAFGDLGGEPWVQAEAVRLDEAHAVAQEERAEVRLLLGQDVAVVPELRHLVLDHPLRERPVELLVVALHRSGAQAEALEAFRACHRRLAEVGLAPSPGLRELGRRVASGDALDVGGRGSPAPRTVRGYRLGEVLGAGASATVHRAAQPGTGREVALKLMRSPIADEPAFVRAFDADARVVARLEHPHVVPLYDYWREPGLACFVMRLMRGGTLRDRLTQGAMDRGAVRRMVEQVGDALVTAHAAGVVHRDVRPSNVLFDEHGHAYLSDFGVARGSTGTGWRPAGHGAPRPRPGAVGTGHVVDQRGLAELVRVALGPGAPPRLREVLDRASATAPPLAYHEVGELVSAVLGALDGGVVPPSMTGARAPVNPYRGLLPFDEADADLYHGRDETARRLLARVTGDPGRLVLVVGPSGSGKSSLVRAGLLPRLRAGSPPTTARWFVATLVPGAEPFEALHHALTSISTAPRTATAVEDVAAAVARAVPGRADVLLVVDQLEDLFALGDPATGRRFLHALADAVTAPGTRVRVVATLRADAYDPVLHDHRFGPLAEQATMPIGALDAAGLEAAIVNPAAHVGVHVEPALAATLVADVIDRPGALPLLQFALAEAFEHRQGRVLDLAGYRRRGGVQGAVAARAEGLYQSLPAAERVRVRPLLLRLVHRTADTPPRRVRVLRGDLRPVRGGDDVDDLLDRFVRARLLTADRDVATRAPTVEIAHEALLVAWPRLRDWVADDAELLRVRTHLATSAAAWDRGGRDEDDVYRGGRLEVALDLERAHPDLLAPVERDFLAASTARRDAAALRRRRREEEQSHVNRRLRRQRLGLVALLMGLLVVGLGALGQLLRAQQATRTMATLADSATLGLVSASRDAMTTDRSLALLLAIEARRASDTPATRDHLFAALTDPHPAVVHVARAPGAEIYTGLAAEGELVVAKRADGTLDVLDLPERAFRNRPVASPPLPARGVAVQPGGTIVAAAGFPGDDGVAVVVVDLATGQVLDTVRGPPGTPHEVAFSPDGRDLAIADPDGGVTVRPVAGAGPAQRLDTGGAPATALAFSADGRHVVAGTTDGELLAWARATAGVVGRRDTAHDGIVTRIVVTPDGDLYSAGVDGRVAGWSLPRLTPRGEPFQLEDTAVLDLDLDPTGTTLAIGGHDAVLLWDVAHDTEPESLGASATAAGLAFTPDGELVVARPDGSLAWWRLGPVAGMGERLEPSGPGLPTVSPDGSRLAVWGLGRGVQLFDAATRDHVGALPLGEAVDFWGLAFVGDDHTLATLTCTPQTAGDRPCAGELTVWEAGAGRRLAQTTTPSVGAVLPALVAASPDGRILATGHADGRVRVWDAETLAPVADAADVDPEVLGAVNTVDVGGDGRGTLLAAANARGEVSVWDLTTPPRLLATEPVGVAARFAPDGTLWTAAEGGRTVARDPRDLEPVGVPLAGSEAPGDLALAPAGDLVAVTSTRAAVWDVPSGQRMAGPIPTLLLAAFVDDGDTLVTGAGGEVVAGTGDVVRVWPLDPAAWDRAACRSAGRNLTSDEWRVHLPGDRPYAPTCPQWPTTEG